MPSSPRILFAPIDTASAGDNTLVAANAKNKIKVISFFLVSTAALAVRFKSGAANNLTGAMAFAANGGLAIPAGDTYSHLFETNVNEALVLNLSGATQVSGGLAYKLEP